MPPFAPMTAAAQTAFANLIGPALQADLHRSIAALPGGFSKKTIRNRVYCYFQYKVEGRLRQVYVGPDNDPAVQDLIARHRGSSTEEASASHLRRLTRAALELGCVAMPPAHVKVLKRLSDHRFFRAGGILIGTHAFLAYQNMLGVHWGAGTTTMDIDFAHPGRNIAIALPSDLRVDTRKAIESLQMGFLPNVANTTYTKADETDFQIDFVTSQGRAKDEPQYIESLNVTLQPLKFMEFSMEDVHQTVVLSPDGPIVVNCPAPERFGLHKLLVAGERAGQFATKALKDIDQAHCLIACLLEQRPGALEDACLDLLARGKGWRSRFMEGLALLRRRHPGTDVSLLMDALGQTMGQPASAPRPAAIDSQADNTDGLQGL